MFESQDIEDFIRNRQRSRGEMFSAIKAPSLKSQVNIYSRDFRNIDKVVPYCKNLTYLKSFTRASNGCNI